MLRLSDIIRHTKKFFEKKRKNPIQLENDSNLESNLKFLKVSDKITPLQISDDTINITGSLTVNGDSVQTGTEAGATALDELSDVTYSSGDLTISSLDKIVAGGDLSLEVDGDISLDATDDIILNADGGEIKLRDPAGGAAEPMAVFSSAAAKTALTLNERAGVTDDDYFRIRVGEHGETTISSEDDAASAAHLTLDADGDIRLDSHTGVFIAKKAGTEFSAANSAYAGMILGYSVFRNLGASGGEEIITIGNSFAVLETSHSNKVNVTFVAPPSGNVEIEFTACVDAVSKAIYFALSDNATYNELNAIYTYDAKCITIDETDEVVATVRFPVTGLTAGTSYQYWIGAKASSASAYIYHGINRFSAHSPPITVKAIALPATILSEE